VYVLRLLAVVASLSVFLSGCAPDGVEAGRDTEEVNRASLRQVLLPKELAAAAESAHRAMLDSGNTTVEVRAYEIVSTQADLPQILDALRPRLPYGKHLQPQGTLDRAAREAKLVEFGADEESDAHVALLKAIDGFAAEPAVNENLWLSYEYAPADDSSASSSEWADWIMVFYYRETRRVVTLRLHYES
jgi:hypothetical protein